MPDNTKPAQADSVEDVIAEMREAYDVARGAPLAPGFIRRWADRLAALSAASDARDAEDWREGWAISYSGPSKLYGDDGELQDNSESPFIDWRRDSAKEILSKIQERAVRRFAAMQQEGRSDGR